LRTNRIFLKSGRKVKGDSQYTGKEEERIFDGVFMVTKVWAGKLPRKGIRKGEVEVGKI